MSFFMELSERGKTIYNELQAHVVQDMGFRSIDSYLLMVLSDAIDKHEQCAEVLTKEGLTMNTRNGYLMARPELAIQSQLMGTINKLSDRFGLSPSARKSLLGRGALDKERKRFEGFDLTEN
jgi:P27 family predicted phage terminase small subunit